MNIVMMDFSAERREKDGHLRNLILRLAGRPGVKLLLVSLEGSFLERLAREVGLESIACKNTPTGRVACRIKLNWRLRKADTHWLLNCFDQKSLELATQVAAKKDHLNIIFSALQPEPVSEKKILDQIHLIGAVIADTKEIADILAPCGFLPSSIFVVPSCIDPAEYLERRERLDKRAVFACSDTLEHGRGYDQLLEGLAMLYGYEDMPAWEVRIASGGPMFEEFLQKAADLNVLSRLAVFGGFPGPEILRDCDVMIAPASRSDGSSMSIKEGWASGLAVLCSDTAAHKELVAHGENGLLFQNGNPAQLAELMHSLAKDAPRRKALAQAGMVSLKEYSCESMLHQHLAVYQKFLGQEAKLDSLDI